MPFQVDVEEIHEDIYDDEYPFKTFDHEDWADWYDRKKRDVSFRLPQFP